MKEEFKAPLIEVLNISDADVIATSDPYSDDIYDQPE